MAPPPVFRHTLHMVRGPAGSFTGGDTHDDGIHNCISPGYFCTTGWQGEASEEGEEKGGSGGGGGAGGGGTRDRGEWQFDFPALVRGMGAGGTLGAGVAQGGSRVPGSPGGPFSAGGNPDAGAGEVPGRVLLRNRLVNPMAHGGPSGRPLDAPPRGRRPCESVWHVRLCAEGAWLPHCPASWLTVGGHRTARHERQDAENLRGPRTQ